jgi:hypothetical protein
MSENQYDYSQYSTSPAQSGLNLFEKLILIMMLIPLIIFFVSGFAEQNIVNKDDRKRQDITEVMKGLDLFYLNSSTLENSRNYPVSKCSGQLNEVDFEYSLNRSLTGRNLKEDTNIYIDSKDFPTDPFGQYSVKKAERKVPFRTCPSIQKNENDNILVYKSSEKSCNFSITETQKLPNCYLYSTDQNGLSYKIGYFSEQKKGFVIWDKFKNNPVVESFSAN